MPLCYLNCFQLPSSEVLGWVDGDPCGIREVDTVDRRIRKLDTYSSIAYPYYRSVHSTVSMLEVGIMARIGANGPF